MKVRHLASAALLHFTLAGTGLAQSAGVSTSQPTSRPSLESPAGWLDGKEGTNLTLAGDTIRFEGRELARVRDCIAAAYYPKHRALVVVDSNCRTTLYVEASPGSWKQAARDTFDRPATQPEVRFTPVAGLVYIVATDPKAKANVRKDVQQQIDANVYRRVAIGAWADPWQAIPSSIALESPLRAVYGVTRTGYSLYFDTGRTIHVELPEPLGEPFRSGPGDALARAVFNFPGLLVSRTKTGWAMNHTTGRLAKFFPDGKIAAGQWETPVMCDDGIHVIACTGSSRQTYKLDVETGKLEPVKDKE